MTISGFFVVESWQSERNPIWTYFQYSSSRISLCFWSIRAVKICCFVIFLKMNEKNFGKHYEKYVWNFSLWSFVNMLKKLQRPTEIQISPPQLCIQWLCFDIEIFLSQIIYRFLSNYQQQSTRYSLSSVSYIPWCDQVLKRSSENCQIKSDLKSKLKWLRFENKKWLAMSLFLRRSISESSENLQRSPSLASIRERSNSTDSWSTHETKEDRDGKIQCTSESKKLFSI